MSFRVSASSRLMASAAVCANCRTCCCSAAGLASAAACKLASCRASWFFAASGFGGQLLPQRLFLSGPFSSRFGSQPRHFCVRGCCLGPLGLGKRCVPFRSQPAKLGAEFGGRIDWWTWRLEWASLEALVVKGAIKPDTQLPRHFEARKRCRVITLAAMCCSVTVYAQLMKRSSTLRG
jgi:hypothetical protein